MFVHGSYNIIVKFSKSEFTGSIRIGQKYMLIKWFRVLFNHNQLITIDNENSLLMNQVHAAFTIPNNPDPGSEMKKKPRRTVVKISKLSHNICTCDQVR